MSKYVPPALRDNSKKKNDSGVSNNTQRSNNEQQQDVKPSNNNNDRSNNYSQQDGGTTLFDRNLGGNCDGGNRRDGGRSFDRRGGGRDNRRGGPPPTNSRWGGFDRNSGSDDRRGGYDNRRGGYDNRQGGFDDRRGGYDNRRGGGNRNSRHGYGRQGGGQGRTNELGYHGSLRKNQRIETELFGNVVKSGINFDQYDNIPIEVGGEGCPEPISDYTAEVLGAPLFACCELAQYSRPTPIQKYSIPVGSAGRDLMACAQTGSGKTAGFLFPAILVMLREGPRERPEEKYQSRYPRAYPGALIMAPTRELASQIHDEARKFTYMTGLAPVVVYGGADVRQQMRELERGCDILTATPGRLGDLIERGRISLACVRLLILDEADRMLDMGFEPQIRKIVEEEDLPLKEERQTFMFSATFPPEIQRLAGDFLNDYVFLAVGRVGAASNDVTQHLEFVEEQDKTPFLIKYLNTIDEGLVLIFVMTKRGADSLENTLIREGFPTTSIHGDRSQREREDALNTFRSGQTPIMVATDVAARGLDIKGVTHVINYDMPTNIDDYVHRIGRTGRIGALGQALGMMNDKNRNIVRELHELISESNSEVPTWLDQMNQQNRYGGRRGGGGGRRKGGNFGARDYRRGNNNSNNNNRNNNRGGGGYGGGNFGGGNNNNRGQRGGGDARGSDNSAW
jgi:ATP-dependent RNA helicase DDX3X